MQQIDANLQTIRFRSIANRWRCGCRFDCHGRPCLGTANTAIAQDQVVHPAIPPTPAQTETDVVEPPAPASETPATVNADAIPMGETMPIELAAALYLAGADNWNVRIARERICEAEARYDQARAMWLPLLNLGVGYTHHEGQIQATDGTVSPASRSSLLSAVVR